MIETGGASAPPEWPIWGRERNDTLLVVIGLSRHSFALDHRTLSAYSVEKVVTLWAFWADSVSLLIWEIEANDGSKEGSSGGSVLRVLP